MGTVWLLTGYPSKNNGLRDKSGGEGGIRTPDTLASMPHFECGAFNHSATSPRGVVRRCRRGAVDNGSAAIPQGPRTVFFTVFALT